MAQFLKKEEEEDDIPLSHYLNNNLQLYEKPPILHSIKPLIIVPHTPKSVQTRPSYPNTPSSLLDTFSDEEDDEDLVPIAVLQSPVTQRTQFQSAAEKYKEKVKAQLYTAEKTTLFQIS